MTGMDREEFEWIQERFKKTVENSSRLSAFQNMWTIVEKNYSGINS